MWPFDACVEWSVEARNLYASGHTDLQVYRELALLVIPFNNAVIVRARARGRALVELQDQTGIDVWPTTINIAFPQPPSVSPALPYSLWATVKVRMVIDGDEQYRTMVVAIPNGTTGAVAEATIDAETIAFALTYNTVRISWTTTFWR